jgi:regulator of nucleoside diphosphate kinase
VASIGSKVQFRDLDSRTEASYTLVFPRDADISESRLSVLAPLGAYLLGASAGHEVEVRTPAGIRRLAVLEVIQAPRLRAA